MSGSIQVHLDKKDMEKKLKKLKNIKNGVPKAVMSAMNKTVTGMKVDAGKEITSRYKIKKKDFIDRMKTEKATMSDLSVTLRSTGRSIRLVKFATKPNDISTDKEGYIGRSFRRTARKNNRGKDKSKRKSGSGGWNKGKKSVFAHVKKSSSGGETGGFMATMSTTNGITGAFVRTGVYKKVKKGRYKGIKKEKLRQLIGPDTVQMLSNAEVKEAIPKKATERFNKALDNQINYLLNK